ANERERRFRRAKHAHAVLTRREGREPARERLGRMLVGPRDDEARQPSERRIVRRLAPCNLAGVERLAVGSEERAHHRMLGLMSLQIADAAALLTAGAADNLVQELERPLGGTWIAVAQPKVGVDDADQVELGEMVALGNELCADDDVDQAALHLS